MLSLVLLLRAKPWERVRWSALRVPLPRAASVDKLEIEAAPAGAAAGILEATGWRSGDRWGLFEARRVRARLEERFRYVREARVRRSWMRRSVKVTLVLREPVARITGGGLLSRDGIRFTAPEELFGAAELPEVDMGALPAETDLRPLSRLLAVAQSAGTLPARLVRFEHAAQENGWVARLEDGTRLLWGRLEWTEEKFVRLAEVLADAGPRFSGDLTADLRHFEDGKILVRPR